MHDRRQVTLHAVLGATSSWTSKISSGPCDARSVVGRFFIGLGTAPGSGRICAEVGTIRAKRAQIWGKFDQHRPILSGVGQIATEFDRVGANFRSINLGPHVARLRPNFA